MSQTETLRQQILSQQPTEEQTNAIFAEESEFLLRASPGSGKTWTSCRRFIWRGANWNYPAGGLALLSFTNTAVHEFHQATVEVGRRGLLSDPNYVGTFDSFVERFIITPFGHLAADADKRPRLFATSRPGDRANKKIQGWTEVGSAGKKRPVPAWEIIPYPENETAGFKASNAYGGKVLDFKWGNPVIEFFKLGFYTHAQRVFLACYILSKCPHITRCLARRFPEIIVDEAQDTNAWLLILLSSLRSMGTKVTLIGDPDQCIYEFSLADATSLHTLKKDWNIDEFPLNKSFRCNDSIAAAARNISGNLSFVGFGSSQNEHHGAYIIRESDNKCSRSISEFEQLLKLSEISETNSAILCRAHNQLEAIRGDEIYTSLQGITKAMAQAAFYRDVRKDYRAAYKLVEKSLREMVGDEGFWETIDENPDTAESLRIKMALWKFAKSSDGLPQISESATEWINKIKANLTALLQAVGVTDIPAMGQKIRRTGLGAEQLNLALFTPQTLFPKIHQETIHQAKGKSIDGVLVLGSARFYNAVVKSIGHGDNSEERRLAYVAMTRARHTLLVSLPASHYDQHVAKWLSWGFTSL